MDEPERFITAADARILADTKWQHHVLESLDRIGGRIRTSAHNGQRRTTIGNDELCMYGEREMGFLTERIRAHGYSVVEELGPEKQLIISWEQEP